MYYRRALEIQCIQDKSDLGRIIISAFSVFFVIGDRENLGLAIEFLFSLLSNILPLTI
jgi:hypothetical protein